MLSGRRRVGVCAMLIIALFRIFSSVESEPKPTDFLKSHLVMISSAVSSLVLVNFLQEF